MRKRRRELAVMAGRRSAVDNKYTLIHVEFEVLVEYPNREFKGKQLTS